MADLDVDADGEVVDARSTLHSVTQDVPTDPAMDEHLAWVDEQVGPLRRMEVGRITADVSNLLAEAGNIPAGYLVADAFAAELPDVDVAFTNQGGLRAPLTYAAAAGEEEDGIVTYEELFALLPFGNGTVAMDLTGAQIEALLEQQFRSGGNNFLQPSAGLQYLWDGSLGASDGDRVDPADVLVGGEPLDLDAAYRVAANSFIGDGGAGFGVFVEGTNRAAGRVDVEVVRDFLATTGPYTPPPLDRIGFR